MRWKFNKPMYQYQQSAWPLRDLKIVTAIKRKASWGLLPGGVVNFGIILFSESHNLM
jgi:hypothetical protein